MKTKYLFLCFCFYSLLLLFAGINQAEGRPNDALENDKDEKSEFLKTVENWKKAVIHLECATDSRSVEERVRSFRESSQKDENILIRGSRDIRIRGTAIFIRHENRRYLITARHVVHDTLAAARQIKEEEKRLNSQPTLFREFLLKSVKESAEATIFAIIFRVPSLEEVLAQVSSVSNKKPEMLMNLGAGGDLTYTFSNSDIDLAIISLDQRDSAFADELISLGYVPVSTDKIADEPSSGGAEVLTVGYPVTTSIIGEMNLNVHKQLWQSRYFSLPTFAFGKVAMLNDKLDYFWCDMSVYPGNSGGPVVEDGKLVGIISAQPILEKEKQRVLFGKMIKAKYVKRLFEIQIEKDKVVGTELRK